MDKITLKVKECSEFETLGECYEGIESVDEAIHIWKGIPSERMNGIKSIGMVLESEDTYWNGAEVDILVGKHFDLEMIEYVPVILKNEQAQKMVKELMGKMPEVEVVGIIPEQLKENKISNNVENTRVRNHR